MSTEMDGDESGAKDPVEFGLSTGTVQGLVQHNTWSQRSTQVHMALEDYERIVVDNVVAVIVNDVTVTRNRAENRDVLDLARRGITEKVLAKLIQLEIISQHLNGLDLSDNPLGSTGLRLLSAKIISNNHTLRTLRLSQCGLGSHESFEDFCKAVNTCHILENLDVSQNDLTNAHIEHLGGAILDHACALHSLTLSGNTKLFPPSNVLEPLATCRVHHILLFGIGNEAQQKELDVWEEERKVKAKDRIRERMDLRRLGKGGNVTARDTVGQGSGG